MNAPAVRLLVDCAPLSGGGGAQVASAFLENLDSRPNVQWQAVVSQSILYALSDRLKNDPRVTVVVKRNWLDLLMIRRRLSLRVANFKPDIVFSVFGPTYFKPKVRHLVGFALPLMIYDFDDGLESPTMTARFKDWLGRRAFRKADHIVVETETVRGRLSQRVHIGESKIAVIGNSINPLFAAALQRRTAKNGDIFSFLVPSAYYRHKNLEIIPQVAAEMRKADPDFNFEFRLTLSENSPFWQKIAASAEQLGVGQNVKTLGVLPLAELAHHYQQASATFLPTLREASTAVYPETFFAEVPLVTTDIDFARELCGDAALYVSYDDLSAVAQTLLNLGRDQTLRARLIEAGKHQLKRTYPSTSEKFEMQMALIQKLVSDKTVQDRQS